MKKIELNALQILNFTVFLQQQRYTIAISFLFYLQNGLSLADFIFFQSIFYFTCLLAEIPSGYIADILPRKIVIIFSYLLFSLRLIFWLFMPNYYTILLGEVLYGLSKAFYVGASDGYIYDYLKTQQKHNQVLSKFGKFNFSMSMGSALSCLIGAGILKYVGFSILFSIELFFNITAILILLFLPNIKPNQNSFSFKEHAKNIFSIIKFAAKQDNIKTYIAYTSILFGVTSVFVWNFQPLMKNLEIPVFMFGVIYFINHVFRALGALNAEYLIKKLSLFKVGKYAWLLYITSFLLLLAQTIRGNSVSGILILIFICISIGFYMVFNVGNISRIHKLISSTSRATISSINSMSAALFAGLFLLIFKYIITSYSIKLALIIFLTLFLLSGFLLKKIRTLSE